jgi:hypothetical protein
LKAKIDNTQGQKVLNEDNHEKTKWKMEKEGEGEEIEAEEQLKRESNMWSSWKIACNDGL